MTSAVLVCLLASLQDPQPPEETVRGMRVPEGFSVQLFAGEPDLVQPVSFSIDDRGRLWVVEMLSYPKWEPRDRIVVFEDTDGDGKFDKRTVFAEGLTYVTGIEVGFGGVWVMAPPKFLFIPDRNGDLKPDGPPEVLLDGFGLEGGHNIANGFTWGPDGWLYAGHGRTSISDVGKPGCRPEERIHFDGGVWRYHPTRRVFEPWCDGTTNPWGVAFDEFGQAFISTCVDVHLYHAIQGGKFEPWRGRESSRYAYRRIPSIADHKHWAGPSLDASRGGKADTLAAGGGHAHCGIMCYLGDTFPEKYRGTLFMNNLHGHRVNNDLPRRTGSGFVASHGPDFMLSSDPMHTGLLLQYGPDGGVFVSDWYDRGECHTRQPDAATGRIYKITYKDTPRVTVDLARLPDLDLVRLQLHRNDWYVTHARRLLQERGPNAKVHAALLEIFDTHPDVSRRLRAMWALHVTGGLTDERRRKALSDPSEYVRAWAIQLEMELHSTPLPEWAQMARTDPSPVVRLYLASAAQRMTIRDRWEILRGLASHPEDAADPNLPLLVWYAAESMATEDPALALSFVRESKIPLLREFMARRLTGIPPRTGVWAEDLAGTIAFSSLAPRGWELHVLDRESGKDTRFPGTAALDFDAVFSPDGRRIAFASDQEGHPEIYTAHPDGSDRRRVTNDPAFDGHPTWSPDSQQILFTSTRTPAVKAGQSWSALYLMRADGKGVERLSPEEASDFSPSWSWWGDLVAFASGTGDPASTDLYVMKPDGTDRRRVVGEGGWPTFAAGSRTIYFHSRRDGAWGIWKVNADGSGLTRITPKDVEAWTPRANRSNLMVVATRREGGSRQIELIDLDTRKMTPLTAGGQDHWNPSLSPDGRWVVYHQDRSVPLPAVDVRESPAGPVRLVRVAGSSPTLSPDGRRIALVGPDSKEIELQPLDGSTATHMPTGTRGPVSDLSWFRGGEKLAFAIRKGSAGGPAPSLIGQVNLGTAAAEVVDEGEVAHGSPAWSPAGTEIAYSVGGRLQIRDLEHHSVRTVAPGREASGGIDWSPTGEWIALSSGSEIRLVKPDGTGDRLLIDGDHPRFSPDGRWLVFLSGRAGRSMEEAGLPPRSEPEPREELFAIRLDGTGLVRLTHQGFGEAAPTWGPAMERSRGIGDR
jgi:putative membrane-bound dehydrogenase-like protein